MADNKEIKIGDYIRVKHKEQKNLPQPAYNFLLSKKIFKVINVLEKDGRLVLDIGFKYGGKEYTFAIQRFERVGEDEIDYDDPHGEEIYEEGFIFRDRVSEEEYSAYIKISDNIGKLWINLEDLSNVCRVVNITENDEKYVYVIHYNLYKKESSTKYIKGAIEFLNNYRILTAGMSELLEKQKVSYEEEYNNRIKEAKLLYEEEVRQVEQKLAERTNKHTNQYKNKIELIDSIINLAKKQ